MNINDKTGHFPDLWAQCLELNKYKENRILNMTMISEYINRPGRLSLATLAKTLQAQGLLRDAVPGTPAARRGGPSCALRTASSWPAPRPFFTDCNG